VNGVFSDEDIFKVRDLALEARNIARAKSGQPTTVGTRSGGAA
jgi:hypothetical protein